MAAVANAARGLTTNPTKRAGGDTEAVAIPTGEITVITGIGELIDAVDNAAAGITVIIRIGTTTEAVAIAAGVI